MNGYRLGSQAGYFDGQSAPGAKEGLNGNSGQFNGMSDIGSGRPPPLKNVPNSIPGASGV